MGRNEPAASALLARFERLAIPAKGSPLFAAGASAQSGRCPTGADGSPAGIASIHAPFRSYARLRIGRHPSPSSSPYRSRSHPCSPCAPRRLRRRNAERRSYSAGSCVAGSRRSASRPRFRQRPTHPMKNAPHWRGFRRSPEHRRAVYAAASLRSCISRQTGGSGHWGEALPASTRRSSRPSICGATSSTRAVA